VTETRTVESAPLTRRELQVLGLAADGMTNTEVARSLGVTVHAVKFHLASIYRKLGVANRTQAASAFFRNVDAVRRPTDGV